MTVTRAIFLSIAAVLLGACVAPEPEIQVGVQVSHLTASGPQAGLPTETDTLRFFVIEDGLVTRDYASSWAGLSDLDGNGPSDREAVVEIPPDRPVSLMVHAMKATNVLATARVDGLEVRSGQRRYVDLVFTPIRAVSVFGSALPAGRFGHGAALVATDGRVLVTGGFTVAQAVTCPPQLAADAESCFQLVATNEAFLVDPSDGSIYPTKTPMLRARAFHTTTTLGDGRVLIAGGVSGVILGLVRVEGRFGQFEYRPRFVPNPADGYELSARTFEVFDPELNAEESDVGRDGDPEAGGFVGAPGEPTVPGQMNTPRFLHAATLLPGSDTDVMLVGGMGSAESPASAEIFRLERAGGSGFQFPPTRFVDQTLERVWPVAATTADQVVVIGGVWPPAGAGDPQIGPEDILERWSAGSPPTPGGAFAAASACPGWAATSRPENALVGAAAVVFGRDTQRILVSGWMGPLCTEPPEGSPATIESYTGTVSCSSTTFAGRSFTLGTADCSFAAINNPGVGHLLAPVAALPDGGALQAGGFSDGSLHVTSRVEVLTGEFRAGTNLAVRNESLDLDLSRGRAWHTATTLNGGRVLFVGGMNFVFDAAGLVPRSVELSGAVEVYDPGWDPSPASAGTQNPEP
jgi:hypothetical protein